LHSKTQNVSSDHQIDKANGTEFSTMEETSTIIRGKNMEDRNNLEISTMVVHEETTNENISDMNRVDTNKEIDYDRDIVIDNGTERSTLSKGNETDDIYDFENITTTNYEENGNDHSIRSRLITDTSDTETNSTQKASTIVKDHTLESEVSAITQDYTGTKNYQDYAVESENEQDTSAITDDYALGIENYKDASTVGEDYAFDSEKEQDTSAITEDYAFDSEKEQDTSAIIEDYALDSEKEQDTSAITDDQTLEKSNGNIKENKTVTKAEHEDVTEPLN